MAGPERSAFDVVGADQTARAFRQAAERAADVDRDDKAGAEIVASDARRRVPVERGALRRTIRVESTMDTARVVAGSATVPYARPIHYGWPARNIERQPFLDDRRRDDVAEHYEDEVAEIVRGFDRDAP